MPSATKHPLQEEQAKFVSCMRHNGVKFNSPSRPGGPVTFTPQQAAGNTPRYRAAAAKCQHGLIGAPPSGAGEPSVVVPSKISHEALRKAFVAYADCLRENGVKVTPPSAPGSPPMVSTKGIDTTSPQYRAATAKCQPVMLRDLSKNVPSR